ncbi:MAG: hypothetical protein IT585_02220, partial [candidate division Zixibacteria bacterium]|nr:hypothetical protein [candidate division Zixibacteria bacterium]
SWETATFRISLAAQYAAPGDTIRVAAGVYTDPQTIVLNGGLTLIGAGLDSTELRNSGTPTVQIRCEDGNLSISDMMFTSQPASPYPIAIHFSASAFALSVERCRFFQYEGAVLSSAAFLDVKNCAFINCGFSDASDAIHVGWGSGNGRFMNNTFIADWHDILDTYSVYIDWPFRGGEFEFSNNIFMGYHTHIYVALSTQPVVIENNLFLNNDLEPYPTKRAFLPYISLVTEEAIVRNNLFEGNCTEPVAPEDISCVDIRLYRNVQVYNNIFIGEQIGVKVRHDNEYQGTPPFTYTIDHNAFWLESPYPHVVFNSLDFHPYDSFYCESYYHETDTTISVIDSNLCRDPMFVDTLGYLLQAGSPCIDAGRPDILDLDGSRSDIGPFGGSAGQFYVYQDLPPATPAEFTGSARSNGATLQWQKNSESDLRQYVLFKSTTGAISLDSAHVACYFPLDSDTLLRRTPDDLSILVWNDSTFDPGLGARYTIVAVDSNGLVSQPANEVYFVGTAVGDEPELPLPQSIELEQNYPNPFNAATAIVYNLPNIGAQPASVRLIIYNILGQEVRTLVDEPQPPGRHVAYWDGRDRGGNDASSGVYLYSLQVSGIDYVKNRRMVLVK